MDFTIFSSLYTGWTFDRMRMENEILLKIYTQPCLNNEYVSYCNVVTTSRGTTGVNNEFNEVSY